MKKSIIVCLLLSTAFMSDAVIADGWQDAKLNKEVQLALANDGIVSLNIDAGAGDLTVTGKEGQSEITVIARVFGEKLSDDDYVLSLAKSGSKARLIAQFKDNMHNNESIDLAVTMPSSLALFVDHRSGDISIEDVANGITLNDRSGDIHLGNIAGSVKIEDRSGDVVVKDLRGDFTISDRSGDIQLKDVLGDVNIDDSSGDIRAINISGLVTVEDSSGDINIDGAADFKLIDDSSGDVSLRNIESNMK